MLLRRDRYDPETLLLQLGGQQPQKDHGDWYLSVQFSDATDRGIDDFCVYLPEDESEHERARSRLTSFLRQIRECDNAVQTMLESECTAGGHTLRDFKLHIGWMRVVDRVIVVRYWGTTVNTEREGVFRQTRDGAWVNTSPPLRYS